MKKFLDGPTSVEELRRVVMELREREDKKTFFTIMAIVIALLVATTAGVMYLVKRNKDNDFDYEDWDDQWDDEFEYDDEIEDVCEDCEEDDCDACGCNCCDDSDFDTSVKIEQL